MGIYTKAAVEMGRSNDKLKYRIIEKGMRTKCIFHEKLRLKDTGSMSDLLTRDRV